MPLRSSESIGPALSVTNTVMRMKIRRWELAAYRVHGTQVPNGFKLPHDHQKYDGSQEPKFWLSDYLQAVKYSGGSKETTMQSLQLHLSGAARSWLRKQPKGSIGSWDELT
jgi:hypothetical protein